VLRLAVELGYANPDAMLREMTARQLDEWKAFYSLEPWGTGVLDNLLAHFKALYANAHARRGKTYKTEQFRLFADQREDLDYLYDEQEE